MKNVHILDEDIEKEDVHVMIECELSCANVKALEALDYKDVYYVFPNKNPNHKYKSVTV